MLVNSSPIYLTAGQAVTQAANSLKQKTLIDFFGNHRSVDLTEEDEVGLLYIPYYIAATMNRIPGGRQYNFFAAVDGITGEAGMLVEKPEFSEEELEDSSICPAVIDSKQARDKILRCVGRYIMQRKRFIADTEIFAMEIIYKPAYLVPLRYEEGKKRKELMRFVDAESGYVVYRYDLLKDMFPQLAALSIDKAELPKKYSEAI